MSRDVYATALRNSLEEIRKICPDVKCSFLFTRDGTLVAGDAKADSVEMAAGPFQNLAEKADVIGGIDTVLIDGEGGRILLSRAKDMYLAMVTSKDADMPYLFSVTRVIIPTMLKLLESIAPTPLKFVPSVQLQVDKLSGFRSRLVGDTVEMDRQTLKQWADLHDGGDAIEVEIEAFSGKRARFRVRAIEDSALEGKGIIRLPEKAAKVLKVQKGEIVRVKPAGS